MGWNIVNDTKHYYAGAERITSQLGRGRFADVGTPVVGDSLVQAKLQAVTGNVRYPVTLTAPPSSYFSYLDTLTNRQNATFEAYWYHTDHLGSSSWITYSDGSAVQHLHYLPFGEDFVNKKSSSFEGARYTFSAKEKDAETKYSYFGARYYSSDLSVWLSVDPQSDKYPSLSPYTYCANNPVKLVDPNGEEIVIVSSDGQHQYTYMNGKLINKNTNEEYRGGDAFVDNARNKLDQIRGTKTGGKIVDDLQEKGYTVTIYNNTNKSHTYPYEDKSGSSIGWKQSGDDVPTTGGMLANGTISLAHELVHAYDHKNGGDMTDNASRFEGLARCEWIAVFYENIIRQELYGNKASLRNYYSKSNDTFTAGGTGPKLLGLDNKPRLAKGISPLF